MMRSTTFNGAVQEMDLPDGRPKRLKLVLEERGINTKGMNTKKLPDELSKDDNLQNVKMLLEEKIESRGHICLYFPKFDCELNTIEWCSCHTKKFTRAHTNATTTRLRTIVLKALNTCKTELISKFYCTCWDYIKAYDEGHTCKEVDEAVKLYKSDRRIFSEND